MVEVKKGMLHAFAKMTHHGNHLPCEADNASLGVNVIDNTDIAFRQTTKSTALAAHLSMPSLESKDLKNKA